MIGLFKVAAIGTALYSAVTAYQLSNIEHRVPATGKIYFEQLPSKDARAPSIHRAAVSVREAQTSPTQTEVRGDALGTPCGRETWPYISAECLSVGVNGGTAHKSVRVIAFEDRDSAKIPVQVAQPARR